MYRHLSFLKWLTIYLNAQSIIELGVCSGQSTIAFLLGLQMTKGKLWSCDKEYPLPPITQYLDLPSWSFIQDNTSVAIDYIPANNDILLVDASFEDRYSDLELYHGLIRPGGCILVHDTERDIVMDQVLKFLGGKTYNFCDFPYGHGLGVIS